MICPEYRITKLDIDTINYELLQLKRNTIACPDTTKNYKNINDILENLERI